MDGPQCTGSAFFGRHGRALAPQVVDSLAWTVGIVVAVFTRYDFQFTVTRLRSALAVALVAVLIHALVGFVRHLYRGRYAFGSFSEVQAVSVTVGASAFLLLCVDIGVLRRPVPASAPIIGAGLALMVMLGVRYACRLRWELTVRPDVGEATPVLLFGAGRPAQELLRSMLWDRGSKYLPVGLLDDDPSKGQLRIQGVPVVGGHHDIAAAVAATGATTVIFSVSDASSELVRDVRRITLLAGATFKVLPTVSELLDQRIAVAHVRDVDVSDLLGRRQIETDVESIAGCLRGKRVLVTGAGGSIGSELCRQINRFEPAELMMLDRDESALHAVQLSLHGRAMLDGPELILADLRDVEGVQTIFAARRPQVVFHAAALKHLTLLQRHPGEAVKTNIWATLGVLRASRDVEMFVNISTDKAANPTSVLGYSKRITERLTAHAAVHRRGTFLNVRFGNVLGTRGSVLTAFHAQVAAGGPVTVTDPDVTRYFMTIQEAAQLVIQAAAIGRPGEALVLDMGEPVRIAEVARLLVEQADSPIEIVYTGLRPGEKLHEELFGVDESDTRPLHRLISHVVVPPLDPREVETLDPYASHAEVIDAMAALCDVGSTLTGAAHALSTA